MICCKFHGCYQPGRKTTGYCALHRAENKCHEFIEKNWSRCHCSYYHRYQTTPYIENTSNEKYELITEINSYIKKISNKYYGGDSRRLAPEHVNGKRYGMPRAYDTNPISFCKQCDGWTY